MKSAVRRLTQFTRLFDRPFLTGMGSTVDLFGFTFDKTNLDVSTGFRRDAEAIWHDFLFVGMDIQKATEAYETSTAATEE